MHLPREMPANRKQCVCLNPRPLKGREQAHPMSPPASRVQMEEELEKEESVQGSPLLEVDALELKREKVTETSKYSHLRRCNQI